MVIFTCLPRRRNHPIWTLKSLAANSDRFDTEGPIGHYPEAFLPVGILSVISVYKYRVYVSLIGYTVQQKVRNCHLKQTLLLHSF